MKPRRVFDLDGTLCVTNGEDYANAQPIPHRIAQVNELAASCHIVIDTARGSGSGIDYLGLTAQQLASWGVRYNELHVGRKPHGVTIDDRAITDVEFFGDAIVERWPDQYFDQRHGNDARRQRAFYAERDFVRRYVGYDLNHRSVCDVGCSTGEFLFAANWLYRRTLHDTQDWTPECYGMEVNAAARSEAMKHGIRFDKNILTEREFFDVVVFRGTIQHLPEPFQAMRRAFTSLKRGGHIVFLATPNTGSLVYRLFGRLPVSDDARNFWMPSAATLTNALKNLGFEIVAVEYPYLDSGYARPWRDALSFTRRLLGFGRVDFPFKGNMMNVVARKP